MQAVGLSTFHKQRVCFAFGALQHACHATKACLLPCTAGYHPCRPDLVIVQMVGLARLCCVQWVFSPVIAPITAHMGSKHVQYCVQIRFGQQWSEAQVGQFTTSSIGFRSKLLQKQQVVRKTPSGLWVTRPPVTNNETQLLCYPRTRCPSRRHRRSQHAWLQALMVAHLASLSFGGESRKHPVQFAAEARIMDRSKANPCIKQHIRSSSCKRCLAHAACQQAAV